MREYYVYVYLDPRKPGKYSYDGLDVSFLYEPFYVGKGKGNRWKYHANVIDGRTFNTHKAGKIKHIKDLGFDMCENIIKYAIDLTNEESMDLEIKLIKIIGRHDIGKGPLTNQANGGIGSFDKGNDNIAVRKRQLFPKVKMSQKQKDLISDNNSKAVKQLDKNNMQTIAVYKNVRTACEQLGFKRSAIHMVLGNSNNKSAYGYYWEYVDEPNNKYKNLTYKIRTGFANIKSQIVLLYNIHTEEYKVIWGLRQFCKENKYDRLRLINDPLKQRGEPQGGWIFVHKENAPDSLYNKGE